MIKMCRQCGREGEEEEMFRRYAKHGNNVRKTTVGYHTICRDCENFNANALSIYNKGPDRWSKSNVHLIALAKSIYETELAKNLHPTGRLAAILLGDKLKNKSHISKSVYSSVINFANSLGVTAEMVQQNTEGLLGCDINEAAKISEENDMDNLIKQSSSVNYANELQQLIKQLEDGTFDGDETDFDFKLDEIKEKYKDMLPTPTTAALTNKSIKAFEEFACRHANKE